MVNRMQFYIDGAWVDPVVKKSTPVVNPATEEPMYEVALGSKADVDKAVAAARRAFETYSQTSREERVALLTKVMEVYKTRMKDIGAAVSDDSPVTACSGKCPGATTRCCWRRSNRCRRGVGTSSKRWPRAGAATR